MKLILALIFTCALAFGQDAPKPNQELLSATGKRGPMLSQSAPEPDEKVLLRAEIDHLKAQLAVAAQQLEIASLPQVMRTRLAAAEAAEKLKAIQDAPKPEHPKPAPAK